MNRQWVCLGGLIEDDCAATKWMCNAKRSSQNNKKYVGTLLVVVSLLHDDFKVTS